MRADRGRWSGCIIDSVVLQKHEEWWRVGVWQFSSEAEAVGLSGSCKVGLISLIRFKIVLTDTNRESLASSVLVGGSLFRFGDARSTGL